MSFWKKLKRGFKRGVNWVRNAAGSLGRGIKKGTNFVKKVIGRATKIPIVGRLLKKVGDTKLFGLPSISSLGEGALNVVSDVGNLASKLETDIGRAQAGDASGLKDTLQQGVRFARSRLKK